MKKEIPNEFSGLLINKKTIMETLRDANLSAVKKSPINAGVVKKPILNMNRIERKKNEFDKTMKRPKSVLQRQRKSFETSIRKTTSYQNISTTNNGNESMKKNDSFSSVSSTSSMKKNYFNIGVERRLQRIALSKNKEGKWEESADLFMNVVKLKEERLEENHPEVAWTKYQVACNLYRIEMRQQAIYLLKEALLILETQQSNAYVKEVISLLNLLKLIEEEKGDIESADSYSVQIQKYEEEFRDDKIQTSGIFSRRSSFHSSCNLALKVSCRAT